MMDIDKISNLIKNKRKELGITQSQLAEKLFVTEKAISRWETGKGTPNISLLIPLANELKIDVSELLNGEENKKNDNSVEQLIEYNEITKMNKYNFKFKLTVFCYIISILSFLIYLRLEYNPNIELNYFTRLCIIIFASVFIIAGNNIYANNHAETIKDKNKVKKYSQIIVFIYYIILMFNMVIFARFSNVNSYNLIPFHTIIEIVNCSSMYSILINIFGNLLIFIPLEYFIIELFNVRKFLPNFLISTGTILLIEILQFILKVGVFDIDDIILCVLGMMLYYAYYKKINGIKKLNKY